MLSERIKHARKQKGMSQEELAVRINVVRQTVSKYENGLSVPDADILIRLSEALEVSVSDLLGIQDTDNGLDNADLSHELERLNKLLAEKSENERLLALAGKKRGLIMLGSIFSLIFALTFHAKPVMGIILSSACLLFSLIVLYRNLTLLTSSAADRSKQKILKFATIFDIFVLLITAVFIILSKSGLIPAFSANEKYFAVGITVLIIVVIGSICPKLPFNRHTGLRLPWTVYDEETWNLAHKLVCIISPPIAVFYIAAVVILDDFALVSIVAVLAWVGIPSLTSLFYYLRKYGFTGKVR